MLNINNIKRSVVGNSVCLCIVESLDSHLIRFIFPQEHNNLNPEFFHSYMELLPARPFIIYSTPCSRVPCSQEQIYKRYRTTQRKGKQESLFYTFNSILSTERKLKSKLESLIKNLKQDIN